MQAIMLLITLLLRDAFIHLREMLVASRLFLASIPLRSDFIELMIEPLRTLKATHMVEPALLVGADCELLDPQIKGDDLSRLVLFFLPLVAKGCVVVASPISGDRYLTKFLWCWLSEFGLDIWVFLVLAASSSWQDQHTMFDLEIGSWIAQSEEAVSWPDSGKTRLLCILAPLEEGIHRGTQAKEDLLEKLVIHVVQLWIMLTTLLERLLCHERSGP